MRGHLDAETEILLNSELPEGKPGKRFIYCSVVYAVLVVGMVTEFSSLNYIITKNGLNLPEWTANIIAANCAHSLDNAY